MHSDDRLLTNKINVRLSVPSSNDCLFNFDCTSLFDCSNELWSLFWAFCPFLLFIIPILLYLVHTLSPYKYMQNIARRWKPNISEKHQANISVSRYKLGRWPSNVCDHVGGNVWQVCLGVPALCDIVCDTSVSWGPNTVTFCHGFRLRHAAIRSSQCHSVEPQSPMRMINCAQDPLCQSK